MSTGIAKPEKPMAHIESGDGKSKEVVGEISPEEAVAEAAVILQQ